MRIKDLLLIFYSDEEVQKVFSSPLLVSYRSTRKIKDYIVRSKLYSLERNVGCRGFGNNRCQVCKNIKVTDTSDSFATKKVTKSTINLTTMISACRRNNYKMEARKAKTDDMEMLQKRFYKAR